MRRLQDQRTAAGLSGASLAAYIAAHMSAVFLLGRLLLRIDTGTKLVFQDGYLPSPFDVRSVTHYGLAAFAVIAHPGCRLRDFLLSHGVSSSAADRIFWSVVAPAVVT